MATFPKLLKFQNPWDKTLAFFKAGEAPSSSAEQLPNWKQNLLMRIEQADINTTDEQKLNEAVRDSKAVDKVKTQVNIVLQIQRAEAFQRSGNKYGDLVSEVATKNEPITFLENSKKQALSNRVAEAEVVQDAIFDVNFGVGVEGVNQIQARQAQRRIGLHQIFAKMPQVSSIEVTPKSGPAVTLFRCTDGKYREAGKTKGRHYPIYQGYKVKVLEIGGLAKTEEMAPAEAEVKRENDALDASAQKLKEVQTQEAASSKTETQGKMGSAKKQALEAAGVYASAKPAETSEGLENGVLAVADAVFTEGKEGRLTEELKTAVAGKSIVSIDFRNMRDKPQMILLTLKNADGSTHDYVGISDAKIGVNELVSKKIPAIAKGQAEIPSYFWNREAYRDLLKNLAKGTESSSWQKTDEDTYKEIATYKEEAAKMAKAPGSAGSKVVVTDSLNSVGSPYNDGQRLGSVRDAASTGLQDGTIAENSSEVIGPLKWGEGARLPDAMKTWTVRDFEANKYRIDYMDQFWGSLQVIAKKSGKKEMDLLKTFLDGDKITTQELTRQVYGLKSPKAVWDEYAAFRLYKDRPESDNDKNTNILRKGTAKEVYYTVDEAKAFVADYEEFAEAGYRLLEAARLLEQNNANKYTMEVNNTQDQTRAKEVIASVFDPSDQAPIAKRTLWEVLTKDQAEFEATMDGEDRSYLMKGQNRYETSISSSGAYSLLQHEFANKEVNFTGLSARLTTMKKNGLLFYDQMAEKDRRKLARSFNMEESTFKAALETASNKPITETRLQDKNDAFDAQEKLLIQLGMIPEAKRQTAEEDAVLERQKLTEMTTEAKEALTASLKIFAEAYKKETGVALSPEEIKKLEQDALSQLAIRENKGSLGLGFADINNDSKTDLGVGYARNLVTLPIGEKGFLSLKAGMGVAFIEDISVVRTLTLGASATAGKAFGKQGQNTASVTVGASVGIGHAEIGAMAGIKVKGQEQGRVWYLGVGAGATAGVGLQEGGASAKFVYAEIGRDIDSAAQRKYLKLKEKNPEFDKELSDYVHKIIDNYQVEIDKATEGMSEVQKNQFLKVLVTAITQTYLEERGNEAVSELFPIQFGKLGLALGVGPLGPLVPYFAIKLKGRQVVRYFKSSDDQKMDAIADAKIREQLAAVTGASIGDQVYLSGDLTMNDKGERTIEGSLLKFEQARSLEGINARLKAQGMQLVEDPNDKSKLTLQVEGVDGFVNIFVDPESTIQASLGAQDGRTYGYLNLDYHDAFNILRVDKNTAFKDGGGGVRNVDIYITNNPQKSLVDIKNRSGDRITWRQTDIYPVEAKNPDGTPKNTIEDATHVARSKAIDTTAAFKNEAEMLAANGSDGLGDLADEAAIAARKDLGEVIQAILGQSESSELNESNQKKLDSYIQKLIKTGGIDYKNLTSEDSKDLPKILAGAKTLLGGKMNNEEATYLLQNLLVWSRVNNSGMSPEALQRHIEGWNARALENFCRNHGIDATAANSIMDAYATKLNLGEGKLTSTKLEKGYAFHTLIGPTASGDLGRGINSGFATELAGMEELTVPNLTASFGLTDPQAQAFIDAQLREFRHLSNTAEATPLTRMKSPMGMQLLQQANELFEPAIASALIAARQNGNIDKSAPYWESFEKALNQLEQTGTFIAPSGYVLTRTQHMVMGFLESCRNFTVAFKEDIQTNNTNAVIGTDTFNGATGTLGNNLSTAAAAVMVEAKPTREGNHEGSKKGTSSQSSEQGNGANDGVGDGAHKEDFDVTEPESSMFE